MSTRQEFAAFDWSAWPVVRITYPQVASVEAVENVFVEINKRARTGEPFAVVGDLRPLQVSTANASVRAAFAENAASDRHARPAAEAIVLGSALSRGLVTAYQWLSPAKHPQRVFEDMDEATAWARSVLDGISER